MSEKLAAKFEAHVDGIQLVNPMRKCVKVKVADACEMSIREQTEHTTVLTLWAPVERRLTLTILPGVDDFLVTGSNCMRDRLDIDVLATLRGKFLVKQAVTNVSQDASFGAVVESRGYHLQAERTSKIGPVQVTLEGKQVTADKPSLTEAREDIKDALIASGRAMFINPSEERPVGVEALKGAALKYRFFATGTKWCERIYSGKGVTHDPQRVQALAERRPGTVGDLMQVLQVANWMRRHLPCLTEEKAPLI